jgi:hypothetical protein
MSDILESWAATSDNLDARIGDEPTEGEARYYRSLTGRRVMAFEKEMETYNSRRDELLKEEGKFVVIQGDQVAGTWDTYDDALKAAYSRFKLEGFMVKQILTVDPVYYVTCELPHAVSDGTAK